MYRKYIKRLLDIVFSIIFLIILFPLIIITFLITLIHLGRPVIDIRMKREGLHKKPFYMYKFRTRIYDTSSLWGRKTKLSKFIDDYKFNELPQLFNILIGDMSFVGPRAFIVGETLPGYEISEKRYLVKPGLTGLAQVSGGNFLSHKKKLEYDVIYYDNLSFLLDLKIILKTPFAILKKKNTLINK